MASSFVGRDRELTAIGEALGYRRARSGVVAVLVSGPAGSGKSRLLEEACPDPGVGARLMACGFEAEQQVPLAAARDLLDRLASVEHEGPRLAQLLASRPTGPAVEPLQVFEAAHRCTSELGCTLLVVDDLQWVDQLTLGLCHHLVRAATVRGHSLRVLAASRPGRAATSFGQSLGRLLAADDRFIRVALDPLDEESGVRLVNELDPLLDAAVATQVWQLSGGIPFWIEQLVQAGADTTDPGAMISGRLEGASPDAVRLLAVLAVAGPSPLIDVPDDLPGWPAARADEAGRELFELGLIASEFGRVRLVHDLVRDAVVANLPPDLIRETRAQVADRLVTGAIADDVRHLRPALAHRRAAGLRSLDLALRLARSPERRLLDPADIVELTQIAEDEGRCGNDPPDLWREIAQLASEIGDPQSALDRWTAFLFHARSAPERARAALEASKAALQLEDRAQAGWWLAECRAAAVDDTPLTIEIDAHESELAHDDRAKAATSMRRAVDAAQRFVLARGGTNDLSESERRSYLAARQAELYVALRAERYEEMLDVARAVMDAARSVDDRIRATLHMVLALRCLGRYREAERRCRSARLEAVRQAQPAFAVHAGHLWAGTLYLLGRLADARSAAADIVTLIDRAPVVVPPWLSTAWIASLPHEIDISLRGWRESARSINQLAATERDPHFRMHIHVTAAQWAARLGGKLATPDATKHLAAGGADADSAGCARCASEYLVRAAQAHARLGQAAEARALLASWDDGHEQTSNQVGFWRRHANALVVRLDDPGAAIPVLDATIAEAQSMGARLEELWARLDRADALTVDRDTQIVALQDAVELAGAIGAVSEERRARRALRGLGVRAWKPTPHADTADTPALTERETEIASMVAAGATNPEIAEAMFLSRKTIERHVSNILTKRGVRNRAHLAATLTTEQRLDP